jgi:hypothetical protein
VLSRYLSYDSYHILGEYFFFCFFFICFLTLPFHVLVLLTTLWVSCSVHQAQSYSLSLNPLVLLKYLSYHILGEYFFFFFFICFLTLLFHVLVLLTIFHIVGSTTTRSFVAAHTTSFTEISIVPSPRWVNFFISSAI